ncbi:MAG: hydrogenase 4 subunit D [Thermodesulfovibrionaceae bacterium]
MNLLSLILLIPLLGSILIIPLKGRQAGVLASFLTFTVFLLTVLNVIKTFPKSEKIYLDFSFFKWLNLEFGVFNDPLTSIMLILITAVGFFVVFYSYGYMSPLNKDHAYYEPYRTYYFFMLLFIGAMTGVVTATNLLQLFFFWETTTLCSWALISYTKEKKALFSGFKAYMMTHLGGLCFLVAIALMYVEVKSFDFSSIDLLKVSTKIVVFFLLFFAAMTKSAQIPLFTWLPDAMVAPTPVSAYLHAAAMVKAGVYLIARLYLSTHTNPEISAYLVGTVAIFTIIVSVVLYYFQEDLKKLLAYSTIGHLGYIFLGVSFGLMGSKTGGGGGVFHIINHGFAKALLFLSVGSIAYCTGTKNIKELRGLYEKFPIFSLAFLVGVFAIVGIPPFSGFWSKFMIFIAAFEIKNIFSITVGCLLILESIAAFCWYILVGNKILFGKPSEKVAFGLTKIPISIKLSLFFLIIMSLISPLIGYPFLNMIFRS